MPGLRELARRFLEADAAHLGVPLDLASVIAGRAEGAPEVHVTAAADELVKHLAAQPEGARVELSRLATSAGLTDVGMVRPPTTRSTAQTQVGVLVNANHHLVEHRPLLSGATAVAQSTSAPGSSPSVRSSPSPVAR